MSTVAPSAASGGEQGWCRRRRAHHGIVPHRERPAGGRDLGVDGERLPAELGVRVIVDETAVHVHLRRLDDVGADHAVAEAERIAQHVDP